MGFGIGSAHQLVGILDDFDVLQAQDIVLHQTYIMNAIHVDLQNLFALRDKGAVIVPQGEGACNNTRRVHRLGNRHIQQAIIVVKDIRILFANFGSLSFNDFLSFLFAFTLCQTKCSLFCSAIFTFDDSADFSSPGVLGKNTLVFLFNPTVFFGELLDQLSTGCTL